MIEPHYLEEPGDLRGREIRIEGQAGACAHNIVGAKGKDHLVRMSPYLLMYRVNQIQCAMGVVTGTGLRIHPDREKLGGQIAGPGLGEVDLSFGDRSHRAKVEIFVNKALRRVGVGINHNGRIVNAASLGRNFQGLCHEERGEQDCRKEKAKAFITSLPAILPSRHPAIADGYGCASVVDFAPAFLTYLSNQLRRSASTCSSVSRAA